MQQLAKLYPQASAYEREVHIVLMRPSRNKDKRKRKEKDVFTVAACAPEELQETLAELKTYKSYDYYITANTVINGIGRKDSHCFSLCNIVMDLDIHAKMHQYDRHEMINEFVWYFERDLVSAGLVPLPNMYHYTGRGLQIWWSLKETSVKLAFVYKELIRYFALIIKQFLTDHPELEQHFDIDTDSSKRLTGLFRLVDTYNSHTGLKTNFEILHDNHYDINDLKSSLEVNEVVAAYLEDKRKRAERLAEKAQNSSDEQSKKRESNLTSTLKKRLWIIRKLAPNLEVKSSREDYILFLAYNIARQIMSHDNAIAVCKEINSTLPEPCKSLTNVFQEKTIYKYKESKFCECLGISEERYEDLCKEYYKLHRYDSQKLRRGEKKLQKEKIRETAIQLLQSKMRINDVANMTGLSESTVAHLSAELHKDSPKKPWEELGIAKATYYLRLKKAKEAAISQQN